MNDLELYVGEKLVYAIPRKNIENNNIDYNSLTETLIEHARSMNWLDEKKQSDNNALYYKEKYMAGCSRLTWNYFLKLATKKTS